MAKRPPLPPITRADFLVLAGIGSGSWLFLRPRQESAFWLEVQSPAGIKRFSLSDQNISIDGYLGESHIEIRQGAARFISAPCHDQYCLHSGWLTKPYQSALCLPNGVGILLLPAKEHFDAIHY